MNKPFNNQFATQRLRSEDSVTGGNAPAGTASTFKAGDGMEYASTKAFKKKTEVKDVEPKLAAGKAEIYTKKKWGWKLAPSIPNRPSKGGFQYKQMFEDMEEGTLRPVDTSKDSLSPIEYQQAHQYEKFNPNEWEFDDVSKRYIKKNTDADQEMQTEERGQEFFFQVSLRDAKTALAIIDDNSFLSKAIQKQATDFYTTRDQNAAEELYYALRGQQINSNNNVQGYLLEALTYNKFKKESATRPNKDALHEALKLINKKLHEINRLMEYSTNMRTELEEDYSPRTGKVVNKLEKQLAEIYKKVKSLK